MTSVRCSEVRVSLGGAVVLDLDRLEVESSEWVTVIGANGAGKSTLLRAIAGLVRSSGSIAFDGRAIGDLGRREAARTVAVVPQAPVIPTGATVADYVALGRTPHHSLLGGPTLTDQAVAADAMARLDVDRFAAREVTTLSGGERQRVFLARAIAQAAPVLLLDEPTTALDIGHQQQVLDLVDGLRRDQSLTVISTMHDLTLAGQYSERICLLDAGRRVASGDAEEVLTEANLSRYYDARVRVVRERGSTYVLPLRSEEHR